MRPRITASCRVVIVPVPEIETFSDKAGKWLDKTLGSLGDRIDRAAERREEERPRGREKKNGTRTRGRYSMKLVLATQNPKKLKEMNEILSHLGVEVVSEAELGVRIEVEETGETFTDNARLKATAVMQATGLPAVADDSGLCVDALNGGPGVYSARFGGED